MEDEGQLGAALRRVDGLDPGVGEPKARESLRARVTGSRGDAAAPDGA